MDGHSDMIWCVGITDDPDGRRRRLDNPPGWFDFRFDSEAAARQWLAYFDGRPDYVLQRFNRGWRHGYCYGVDLATYSPADEGSDPAPEDSIVWRKQP